MIDEIVLDVETQRSPYELAGGFEATDKLGMACCVVYEYLGDRYRVYGPDDLPELCHRIREAERITGFNLLRFDLPVIFGCTPSDFFRDTLPVIMPANDVLARIMQQTGTRKGWSLDNTCRGTLGRGKIAQGSQAPDWFKAGNWSSLITYCMDDVALTRDLAAFVDRYGYVRRHPDGLTVELPRAERRAA